MPDSILNIENLSTLSGIRNNTRCKIDSIKKCVERFFLKRLIFLLFFISPAVYCNATLNKKDTILSKNYIQIEIGGKNIHWSISYMRSLPENRQIDGFFSVGIGYLPNSDYKYQIPLSLGIFNDLRSRSKLKASFYFGLTPVVNFKPYPLTRSERKYFRSNKEVDSIAGDDFQPVVKCFVTPSIGLKYFISEKTSIRLNYYLFVNYSFYREYFSFVNWAGISLDIKLN